MLSVKVEENKENFIMIVNNNIKREGINDLMNWLLSEKSDFFLAPASSKYHLAIPGGLCKHSLNVYNRLRREIECEYGSIEASPYSAETLTIVSLFHDLCK